jgi:hypothetical protein
MRSRSLPDWIQGYNVGAVVDDTARVIVATLGTAEPADTRTLPALVDQVRANTGRSPRRRLADAAYGSEDNLAHLAGGAGVDAYVAIVRDHHGRAAPAAPRGRIPAGLSARERMSRKLRTKRGGPTTHGARRSSSPSSARSGRPAGSRGSASRGLEAAQAEWLLVAAAHNLGKLSGSGRASWVIGAWCPTTRQATRWATE